MDRARCWLVALLVAPLAASPTSAPGSNNSALVALPGSEVPALPGLEVPALPIGTASDASPYKRVLRDTIPKVPKRYLAELKLGDPDLPLRDVDTRYYVPDGMCSGILNELELGCDGIPPATLWVQTADHVRAPQIKVSDELTQVIVRRRHADSGDEHCLGRLWVKLRVACLQPPRVRRSESSRKVREIPMRPAPVDL